MREIARMGGESKRIDPPLFRDAGAVVQIALFEGDDGVKRDFGKIGHFGVGYIESVRMFSACSSVSVESAEAGGWLAFEAGGKTSLAHASSGIGGSM